MTPYPPANPQYREDPPALSKDGKTVRISIEEIHRQQEHNRLFGVNPVEASAAWAKQQAKRGRK